MFESTIGVVLGFLSAIATSGGQVFAKKLADEDPYVLSLIRFGPSIPFLAALLLYFGGFAVSGGAFWVLVAVVLAPLEILLSFLFVRSAALAPISMAGPLLALSSVFLIPAGYLVFGEVPTPLGVAGIFVTLCGALFVSADGEGRVHLDPRIFLTDKGCRLAIYGSLVSVVLVVASKYAFRYGSPLSVVFYSSIFLTIYLAIIVFARKGRREATQRIVAPVNAWKIAGIGVSHTAAGVAHYVGLSLLPVAYFIPIKRFSVVSSVLMGWWFFREKQVKTRLFGAAVMFVGVTLVAIASL